MHRPGLAAIFLASFLPLVAAAQDAALGEFRLGEKFNAVDYVERVASRDSGNHTFVITAEPGDAFDAYILFRSSKSRRLYAVAGITVHETADDAQQQTDSLRSQGFRANVSDGQIESEFIEVTFRGLTVVGYRITDRRIKAEHSTENKYAPPASLRQLITERALKRIFVDGTAPVTAPLPAGPAKPTLIKKTVPTFKAKFKGLDKLLENVPTLNEEKRGRENLRVAQPIPKPPRFDLLNPDTEPNGPSAPPNRTKVTREIARAVTFPERKNDGPRAVNIARREKRAALGRPGSSPPSPRSIKSKFEYTLGDVFDPVSAVVYVTLPGGVTRYRFQTDESLPSFTEYDLYIAPRTNKIFKIAALTSFTSEKLRAGHYHAWSRELSNELRLRAKKNGTDAYSETFGSGRQTVQLILGTPHGRAFPFEIIYLDPTIQPEAARR